MSRIGISGTQLLFATALICFASTSFAASLSVRSQSKVVGCEYPAGSNTPVELDPAYTNFEYFWPLPTEAVPVNFGVRALAERSRAPVPQSIVNAYAAQGITVNDDNNFGGVADTTIQSTFDSLNFTSTFHHALTFCIGMPAIPGVRRSALGRTTLRFMDDVSFHLDESRFPPTTNMALATSIPVALGSSSTADSRLRASQDDISLEVLNNTDDIDADTGFEKRLEFIPYVDIPEAFVNLQFITGYSTNGATTLFGTDGGLLEESLPLYTGLAENVNKYSMVFEQDVLASSIESVINGTQISIGPLPDGVSCVSDSGRVPACTARQCTIPLDISDLGCGGAPGREYPPNIALGACELAGDVAAVIADFTGSGSIRHSDGSVDPLIFGLPVQIGDTIQTDAGASVDLVFNGEKELTIDGGACLQINDRTVIDQAAQPNRPDEPWLRRILVKTSEFLERINPQDAPEYIPAGGPGIRGDARDIIRNDLLNNPVPELGDVGIWVETASPAGVSTYIDSSNTEQNLEFNFAAENSVGNLLVRYAGAEVLNIDISSAAPGAILSPAIALVNRALDQKALLEFVYDGPAGNGATLWNITLDGTLLNDPEVFGRIGAGPVESGYIASSEQYIQISERAEQNRKKTISSGEWNLVSVPSANLPATVADLFADDLAMSDFEVTWIIWGFDAVSNEYVKVLPDTELQPLHGYWIIQYTGNDVELDVPVSPSWAPAERSAECPVSGGCLVTGLEAIPSSERIVTWNLVGNPSSAAEPIHYMHMAFEDETGKMHSVPLADAPARLLMPDLLWRFDAAANTYEALTTMSDMDVWDGAWLPILEQAEGYSNIQLLVAD